MAIENWLQKLKDVAVEVDGSLDECLIEASLVVLDEIAKEHIQFHLDVSQTVITIFFPSNILAYQATAIQMKLENSSSFLGSDCLNQTVFPKETHILSHLIHELGAQSIILSTFFLKEFGLFYGVNKDMEKLSSSLLTVRAVLEDAKEK
ncbi:hypothetical protein FEM48_Zijuj11G0146800 [Ziziphus jujuba var. spinosa]|uniref:Uncharacterized protein n=1 Tax=Ziziphus jujuba var. spinosa TaxID=714518 RepID=A0A978UJJ0_ZIZJJ|nr:hypothetical protein FEM48_Zijuj11G0146800 [Ziziphus jujuba var. spinosa]